MRQKDPCTLPHPYEVATFGGKSDSIFHEVACLFIAEADKDTDRVLALRERKSGIRQTKFRTSLFSARQDRRT
jgi:hypothetical protein